MAKKKKKRNPSELKRTIGNFLQNESYKTKVSEMLYCCKSDIYLNYRK